MGQGAVSLNWDADGWIGENGKEYKGQVIRADKQ